MKKIVCMAAVLALAGTGMAGAFGGIMDTEVGYGYNSAADGIHSAHIEVKPIPKVAVGAEYRHWNNRGNETDVYAKYKIGHFYVGAGNRNYYDRDARLFGLIEGKANVLGPLDAYAGLLVSSEERQYKAGLKLDLVPTAFDIDVNYTYYDRDDIDNEGGLGVGLNYHSDEIAKRAVKKGTFLHCSFCVIPEVIFCPAHRPAGPCRKHFPPDILPYETGGG